MDENEPKVFPVSRMADVISSETYQSVLRNILTRCETNELDIDNQIERYKKESLNRMKERIACGEWHGFPPMVACLSVRDTQFELLSKVLVDAYESVSAAKGTACDSEASKLYALAEQCWRVNIAKWESAKSAAGRRRGYSCPKAMADAYRNLMPAQVAAL